MSPEASVPIRVLIVDDHEIIREGLRTLLGEEPGLELAGEAGSGEEALGLLGALRPDVVLVDLLMPGMGGIELIRRVRRTDERTRFLVLTSYAEDRQVHEAIAAGAIGYLLKDVLRTELVRAIRDANQGLPALHPEAQKQLMRRVRTPVHEPAEELTAREREVLALIAEGQSNKLIAARLGLSEGTVKGYVSAILGKLGVADRTQAALWAVRNGHGPAAGAT
jgi:DNA-binding NarL/FixJ family response regulator